MWFLTALRLFFYHPWCKPVAYDVTWSRVFILVYMLICIVLPDWDYLISISHLPSHSFYRYSLLNINSSNFIIGLIRLSCEFSLWVFPIRRSLDRFSLFFEISTSLSVGVCPHRYCHLVFPIRYQKKSLTSLSASTQINITSAYTYVTSNAYVTPQCLRPTPTSNVPVCTLEPTVMLLSPLSPTRKRVFVHVDTSRSTSEPQLITYVNHPFGLLCNMPHTKAPMASVKQSAPSKVPVLMVGDCNGYPLLIIIISHSPH